MGSAQFWRSILKITIPGDSSLKGKTFETPYQTVPLKSSEKRLFLVAVFRSQTAVFYTITTTSLGTSIHGPISTSRVPKSSSNLLWQEDLLFQTPQLLQLLSHRSGHVQLLGLLLSVSNIEIPFKQVT